MTADADKRTAFFARSGLIIAAIVVVSFPLSYFGPVVTGSRRFDTLHHVHGLAFFAWIGLYAWQAHLVAQGHVARHREIGLAGLVLTGAVIVLGFWMAQRAAWHRLGTIDRPYLNTWFNLIDIALFAAAMLAATLLVTRHREWHRRFALVAALCLMAPAATRWTLRVPGIDAYILDIASYAIVYPFLAALWRHDRHSLGRVHPATLVALAVLLPLHLSSAAIARSGWWNGLAPRLFGPPSSQVAP